MKRHYALTGVFILVITLIAGGCKEKVKPLSERIAKAWTAESVKHGSSAVYTRGGSSNTVPGYASFRLTLANNSGVQTATYTEFEGSTFTGNWALEGESKLILSGLNPAPTGSGGTLEFTINSIEDTKLVLTRITASPKTGGTINEYTLTNP
ncbi:hypothetical protein [Dyadobacter sandarakinus]|uniref:Lipocalin-like domain-containing protein n=1 Tax=Dyadobacter sandarakinus TaxID=2747268 RepID=A0ABX7IA69_9BACT|nr:hypothetical protein [Dyadobacter sandarakinus]QRR02994.1 hypothetical protein HWI92_19810 [Dyadobacter sandarakinus]